LLADRHLKRKGREDRKGKMSANDQAQTSWLNQAEIEISRMTREALGSDRLGSLASLRRRLTPWAAKANQAQRRIDWTFTRVKARKKFKITPRRFRHSAPQR
jgi:hypothetical protein